MTIGKSFSVVLFTVLATFNTFYTPQPLLPYISDKYLVSPTTSALLLTVPFIFLCFSPVFYGALLNRVNARVLLITAVTILAVTQLTFAAANDFKWLMVSRTIQSLLYPAIFTAAVTYCSKAGPRKNVAHRVSLYVASTIIGGLSGRLASGFITSTYGWPTIFQINTASLLLCAVLLYFVAEDKSTESKTSGKDALRAIISNATFISGYVFIFTTFFAFSATLNALPFRLVEIEPDITPANISLVYSGYILGVIIATNSRRLCDLAGGRVTAMTVALSGLLVSIVLLSPANLWWLVLMSFATAACMFMIHSTLSGFLVSLMPEHASMINGLYISIYYAAGALGSILPLSVYHYSGWYAFLVTIFIVAASGLLTLKRLSIHSRHNQLNKDET